MKRHASAELLSAYLDGEMALREARALERHLESCAGCRSRLAGLRRVVHGLGGLDRPAPPPWLQQQVRAAVASQPPNLWRRMGWILRQLPFQSAVASAFSTVLAFFSILFLLSSGANLGERPGFSWIDYPGPVEEPRLDPNLFILETTSEVAGRTFVLQEDDELWSFLVYETAGPEVALPPEARQERVVWVEEGLRGRQPHLRIDVSSPEGRALLSRYQDLGYLLDDGARVVLRHQRETLELFKSS